MDPKKKWVLAGNYIYIPLGLEIKPNEFNFVSFGGGFFYFFLSHLINEDNYGDQIV